MTKKKEISIRCKGTSSLPLNSFQDFQGNLKELRQSEYKKLRIAIERYGFRFPIFVWKNYILDGHQRIFVIKKMVEEGWLIDSIPIVEIEADNEREAKKLVLLVSSRYGHVTNEGLYEFIMTSRLDFDELKVMIDLPEINLKEFEEGWGRDIPEVEKTTEPFKRIHILLSFSPDKAIEIQNLLDQIIKIPGIEYKQGSN